MRKVWEDGASSGKGGTCVCEGLATAVPGMPTCWRTLSSPSTSKRAYTRTCPPGRHPFWIRPDDGRSSRPFIRNAVSITMSRRGSSIVHWWQWNSWSRELADGHADRYTKKLYDRRGYHPEPPA